MTILRAVAGILALWIFGAAARAADTPDFKTTAHTVAILSVLGDRIDIGGANVQAPELDSLGEHLMANQIAIDLPQASVVAVGGSRQAWWSTLYPSHGFGDIGMTQLREALRPWAAAHTVDDIVVLRNAVGFPFPNAFSKFGVFGIALTRNSNDTGVTTAAMLDLVVLDGKTLDIVTDLSVRDVGWESMPYKFFRLSDVQQQALVEDTRAMLSGVVPGLVHGVGL